MHFKCGLGWGCGGVDVVWGWVYKTCILGMGWVGGVVLSVLFDLREHIPFLP